MTEMHTSTNPNDLQVIEQRAYRPFDSLQFSPSHDPFGGDRSAGTWVRDHLDNRIAVQSDETKSKAYLEKIGQNSSQLASRFRGALIGLAIGDALGTTLEFSLRDKEPAVTELCGGGPFNLNPGEWTDDTSMALCLAHSLVRKESFDYRDQLDLYCLWWKKGIFSVNGSCFDIGNTVVNALQHYMQTGEIYSGSSDPKSAGNGSLMRLAPVALFYFSSLEGCAHWCGESSKTTHGAIESVDACRYFGTLIQGAINGATKAELSEKFYKPSATFWHAQPLTDSVILAAANAHKKTRDEIKSTGYVIDTLEAAIWAFHTTDSFEEGAILAANLGGDADTVAAVYGQLAGAYYGELNINPNWIKKLAKAHVFYSYADKLMRFGLCDAAEFFRNTNHKKIGQPQPEKPEQLINLTALSELEAQYEIAKSALANVNYVEGYPDYPAEISNFMSKLCLLPWNESHHTEQGPQYVLDNTDTASISDICYVLVRAGRNERFCDGSWIGTLKTNQLAPLFERLKQLLCSQRPTRR